MFLYVSILLLIAVLLDAVGDAFRYRGWQIPHHAMEAFHVALWIYIWAFYDFHISFVWMYIFGRIVLFDIAFNLTAGLPIGYIGRSSLYDIVLTWFGGWVKQHPIHFVFIFRLIALAFWIGSLIKMWDYTL